MPSNWLRLPHFNQERAYTCTPACVRMVLAFFGHERSAGDLAHLLGTTPRGTLLRDLVRLEALGMHVVIGTGALDDLRRVLPAGIPMIVSVDTLHLPRHSLQGIHTVVVAGATDRDDYIHDPWWQSGPDVLPLVQFERAWRQRKNMMASLVPLR